MIATSMIEESDALQSVAASVPNCLDWRHRCARAQDLHINTYTFPVYFLRLLRDPCFTTLFRDVTLVTSFKLLVDFPANVPAELSEAVQVWV
jgi:hypothetical protein